MRSDFKRTTVFAFVRLVMRVSCRTYIVYLLPSYIGSLDVASQLPVVLLIHYTTSSFVADSCQDFPNFFKETIVRLSRPICLQSLSQNFLKFGLDSRYDITILRAVTQSIATSLKAYFVEIEAAARTRARMTMSLSGA